MSNTGESRPARFWRTSAIITAFSHIPSQSSPTESQRLAWGLLPGLLQTKRMHVWLRRTRQSYLVPQANGRCRSMRTASDTPLLYVDQLEKALGSDIPGHERKWAEDVGRALARVEIAVRQHAASVEGP